MTIFTQVHILSIRPVWFIRKMLPGILFGYMVGWLITNYFAAEVPRTVVSVSDDSVVSSAGGWLTIRTTIIQRRVCPSSTTRYLWRWENPNGHAINTPTPNEKPAPDAIPHRVLLQGGSVTIPALGMQTSLLSIPMPPLDPGLWYLQSEWEFRCPLVPSFDSMVMGPNTPVPVLADARIAAP